MRRFFLVLGFSALLSFSLLAQNRPSVLIAYFSQSGSTKVMAQAISEGAQSIEGIDVRLLPVDQVKTEDLLRATAIIVGSPVYNANIAPEVQAFINSWPFEGRPLQNKIGAAFSTGGGISIGEEQVMLNILQAMLIQGMIVVGGEETEAAFGASAITGEGRFESGRVDELFLNKGLGLGRRVASLALQWESIKK
jgi:NAD(P)H dehydrogenase (quinone)